MSKIYFYKMTVDDGGAPCVQNGLLSLTICKPMIRSTAQPGDMVIGFAASSLYADNRLIYIARVTDKVVGGNYFRMRRYTRRADCIYEWRAGRLEWRAGARFHGLPGDLMHDIGSYPTYLRANALLSREFAYFGKSGSDAYKRAFPAVAGAVMALKRGHRVYHRPKLLFELHRLIRASPLEGARVLGVPHSKPQCGVSHRGSGCGVAIKRPKR